MFTLNGGKVFSSRIAWLKSTIGTALDSKNRRKTVKQKCENTLIYSLLLVSVSAISLAFEPEMVTKDLVGFWSFDQTTIKGKTANDIWSKNHGIAN